MAAKDHVIAVGMGRRETVAHATVPVKVNVWVDEGIAPLVRALNSWDDIVTLDSCEAGPDALAYIQFSAEPVEQLIGVAQRLARCLSQVDDSPAVVAVEWSYGGDAPLGRISCDLREVQRVADLLTSAHTTSCSCGMNGTGPRSSRARRSHLATQP